MSNIRFLRHGTMTSIYLATLTHGGTSETICLKTPVAGMADLETTRINEELEQEAHIMQKFQHLFIVKLIGKGMMPKAGGRQLPFIAISWLSGTSGRVVGWSCERS